VNLLVNLPEGFYRLESLKPYFARLEKRAELRKKSHDTSEEISDDLAWADAVIMWSWPTLTDKVLKKAPNLKFAGHITITREGAGAEIAAGLTISEARHGFSPAVSEMALGLILNSLRKISGYNSAMRNGTEQWVRSFPDEAIDPLERQLTGRNVGIVGFGRIGQRLAELLRPFDVKILAYDPYLPAIAAEKYYAELAPLEKLAEKSEIVVLCAANNPGTENLFSRKYVYLLRKNSILVNVGRASLIDMKALSERLEKEEIIAAIDVFDVEPLAVDSHLRKLKNAYLTPHRAGGIYESIERIIEMLADDFEAFLDGKALKYRIDEKNVSAL
jgi:phosphoglycerate dehydrogenase-like enzyme